MRHLTSVGGLSAVLISCVVGPSLADTGPRSMTLDATLPRVWRAALTAFTDLNIPIENVESASGFIRSDEMILEGDQEISGLTASEIADCGSEMEMARTESGTTYLAFTLLLEEAEGGGTSIRLQSSFRNHERGALGDENVRCVSKGALEDLIIDSILKLLDDR